MQKPRNRIIATLVASGMASVLGAACLAQSPETLLEQRQQYDEVRAKSILELQPFRNTEDAVDPGAALFIRLINLNPAANAWYLLQTRTEAEGAATNYHIENPYPATQTVALEAGITPVLVISKGSAVQKCQPWALDADGGVTALSQAKGTGLPYGQICNGTLFLRNKVHGSRTNIEATSEFLRENVWGGESIVRFVRDSFFKDSQLEASKELDAGAGGQPKAGPRPMQAATTPEDRPVISTLLDIGLADTESGRMAIGLWYPVADLPGVFASTFQPRAISAEVLKGPGTANRLDSVEARATGYMVGFDMEQFDIGLAMGTTHPALGWSPRPPGSIRPRGMPGPDGVKSPAPLVPLGIVNPVIANRAVATFTAGFKRNHGAFKYGDMATYNYGHHYGFIEKGVILSKLQPGLSTLYGLVDGTIEMKTWTEADNALLPQIRFARQNGVPLIETDPETGIGIPGDRVTKWGPGNWSGSAEAVLRTLRAGACMVRAEGTRYLLYGYFSTATPSAMARTFQAYGCDYAMLLDMNALEHTYLALYVPRDGKIHVQHMVPGMALIEKKSRDGTIIPRFIGFADNRDLFYLTRKEPAK